MLDKWIDTIEKSKLFSGIYREEAKLMLKCLTPRIVHVKKGEFTGFSGENIEELGVLLEGSLSIMKENIDGGRIIIDIVKPGELFGEIAVFTEKKLWPATVLANENSVAMFISPDKFTGGCLNACTYHRQLILNMLKIISEKALGLRKKVEYLSIKGMREKLCTYFWEQYKKNDNLMFVLPMKRGELADFLNVSRPSMSREMCRLRDEGLIDFHLSTIKIRNPEKVAMYVQ